jgi:hypothetical protein
VEKRTRQALSTHFFYPYFITSCGHERLDCAKPISREAIRLVGLKVLRGDCLNPGFLLKKATIK